MLLFLFLQKHWCMPACEVDVLREATAFCLLFGDVTLLARVRFEPVRTDSAVAHASVPGFDSLTRRLCTSTEPGLSPRPAHPAACVPPCRITSIVAKPRIRDATHTQCRAESLLTLARPLPAGSEERLGIALQKGTSELSIPLNEIQVTTKASVARPRLTVLRPSAWCLPPKKAT